MATSIQDLLDQAAERTRGLEPTPADRVDALQALRNVGRAMRDLAADGITPEVASPAERRVTDLARACAALPESITPAGRLTQLTGAAADASALLRDEHRLATRWATAIAFNDLTRDLCLITTGGTQPGPESPVQPVWLAAVLLEIDAARRPPGQPDATVLNHSFPVNPDAPTGDVHPVVEAAAALAHHTRTGTHLTVAEVLAVSIAMERLHQHPVLNGTPAIQTAAAWREVRQRLRPFNDGSRHTRADQPPAIQWALRLDKALGDADRPPAPGDLIRAMQSSDRVAANLERVAHEWGKTGNVRALAVDLPARDTRVDQQLAAHRPAGLIHADHTDLAPVASSLRAARTLNLDEASNATPDVPPSTSDPTTTRSNHAAARRADASREPPTPAVPHPIDPLARRTRQMTVRVDGPRR